MKKLLCIIVLLLAGCGPEVQQKGIVIEKLHTPPGSGMSSSGHYVTTNEVYALAIRRADGSVQTLKTNTNFYYNVKVGDEVTMTCDDYDCWLPDGERE